jgi:hypothetical protein
MVDTFTTKLGKTSKAGERSRIWLEGKRLAAAGFKPGTLYAREWRDSDRELVLSVVAKARFEELARDAKGTVSGKGDKPIIDIVGARVTEVFGAGETVSVQFAKARITITAS